METPINILHLEDNLLDAELVQATLESAGVPCAITLTQTAGEYKKTLPKGGFDLILADYKLPGYDGMSALHFARREAPDIPFIFISGTMGEDAAIQALTEGATDYVLKQKLSRLAPAVKRAISDAQNKAERSRAENELRRTHKLLEKIFASTEFMIAYLDADLNFIRVNRAYAEADEHDPEYFVGKNHFALYPNKENEAIFREVVKTGKPYVAYAKPFEYAEHPERGITYWNWTLQPVKEADGGVSGLVFSLINVTEREKAIIAQHESEERFHSLAESANDGIISIDGLETVFYWNKAARAMFGYTDEEILGQSLTRLMPERYKEKFHHGLRQRLSSQDRHQVNKSLEVFGLRKDGSEFPIELSIGSWETREGVFFTGIVRNISERKRHELEREAIITVANVLRTATTRLEILTLILDELNDLFDADGAMLAVRDLPSEDTIVEMGRGIVGEKFTNLRIPQGTGVCSWVIENRKPYLNNNANTDPVFYRPDLLGDSHAVASVPLIAQEQLIGAICIARKNEIKENDVRLLNAIADIAANAIHRVTLHEQTEQHLHRLIALHQIDITISTSLDLNITLNVLLNNVLTQLDVDAASILLLTPHTQTLEYSAGIGFRTRKIEQTRVRLGEGQAGISALQRRIVSLSDMERADETFTRTALLKEEKFVSHYVAPLIAKGQVKGVLEVFTRRHLNLSQEWLDFFETLATQAAIAIDSATLFNNLQRSNTELRLAYDATIEGWSRALDLRDKETEGHTQRVTEMAVRLADAMGMSDMEKLNLRRGALLHDIGKMGIPDAILLKPGNLTTAEWEVMRQHPTYAYEMLAPIAYLKQAIDIPYCHHEKWDESGYPRGLKGEQIPLSARIFAIVDVYDALLSDRPYRPAWPEKDVIEHIREQSAQHFDPHVVDAFIEMMKQSGKSAD